MVPTNVKIENLLNEHDVARITGLSVASVRRWRLLRQGPRYLKLGSAVRYRAEDVSAWIESRPTGDDLKVIGGPGRLSFPTKETR
jgi:predicted DNA-binding transcriptional regulator AlpA